MLAVVAVTAVAAGGVTAGIFLTRGEVGSPAASPAAPSTRTSVPVGSDLGLGAADPTPTERVGPEPDEGQPVVTDDPVVATGSDVPVTVTFHGWNAGLGEVQVGGYVTGVVEEGGVCTLTLTRHGQSVTGQSEALPDASTTACGAVTVPGAQVDAGTWTAVLSYSSPTHTGASETWDIEVPQ